MDKFVESVDLHFVKIDCVCLDEAVVAVGDGLKAWEVIKRKHHKIDLILTEAELPSISGFALLTLVMEHDMCKNIPVISTLPLPNNALFSFQLCWSAIGL